MCSCLSVMKLSTETIEWELLIWVVALQNCSDSLHCQNILISVWVPVMKRLWVIDGSIAQSEINCDLKSYLAASEDVIKERFLLFDLDVADIDIWPSFRGLGKLSARGELLILKLSRLYLLVISIWIKFEKLKQQVLLTVTVSQSICISVNGVPLGVACRCFFAFTFENGEPLVGILALLLDHQEDVAAQISAEWDVERAWELTVVGLLLGRVHGNATWFGQLWVWKVSSQLLVPTCNHIL